MKRALLVSLLVVLLLAPTAGAYAWNNGGYSADPTHPDFGTHDWIAQHALDWLPAEKKQYITDNLAGYLYGTELPDSPATQGGIGDTTKHHIYYHADGTLQDDAAAQRAEQKYQTALSYLKVGDEAEAAKHAGAMTHYIADMAVFGHVMGASTDWGIETHHSDYENHITSITTAYSSTYIKPLQYDGALTTTTTTAAAKRVALDTTFDAGGAYTAKWMDDNYDWSSTAFTTRSWESVNLATNTIADTLSTLYDASAPAKTQTTITITPSKTSAKENEPITISGTINADITTTVTISQENTGTWNTLNTTQTTNGSYALQVALQAGTYTLRATWPGDATHEAAASRQTTITVKPRTCAIRVTVVDDSNTPLQGAEITMTKTPQGQTQLQTKTPTNGTATFDAAKPGAYTINATKTGYKTNTVTITATEDQTNTQTIQLTKLNTESLMLLLGGVALVLAIILGYFVLNRIKRNK